MAPASRRKIHDLIWRQINSEGRARRDPNVLAWRIDRPTSATRWEECTYGGRDRGPQCRASGRAGGWTRRRQRHGNEEIAAIYPAVLIQVAARHPARIACVSGPAPRDRSELHRLRHVEIRPER